MKKMETTTKTPSVYTAPQCLRSDLGTTGNEYSVICDTGTKLSAGGNFYYGVTGRWYVVKKIIEVRNAKVGPGEVYKVTAEILELEEDSE